MSYQFGEEILVSLKDREEWWIEIFIAEADGVVFTALDKMHLKDIMSGDSAPSVNTKHKQIPKKKVIPYTLETFPLDNSGMIRGKHWDKGSFSTILGVSICYVTFGVCGDIYNYDYEIVARDYEWLNKDGTTTPFGIEVDDE